MRPFLTFVELVVLAGCASVPRQPSRPAMSAGAAWREGPRDSIRAVGVACELVAEFPEQPVGTSCRIEAYRETPSEFIVRVRGVPPDGERSLDFPVSEVRLTKDGANAVISRFATL
jgi:hypothetical protein